MSIDPDVPQTGALRRMVQRHVDPAGQEAFIAAFFDTATDTLDATLPMTDAQADRLFVWLRAKIVLAMQLQSDVAAERAGRMERASAMARSAALDCARTGSGFGSLISAWWFAHVTLDEPLDHDAIAEAVAEAHGATARDSYMQMVDVFRHAVSAATILHTISTIGDPFTLPAWLPQPLERMH